MKSGKERNVGRFYRWKELDRRERFAPPLTDLRQLFFREKIIERIFPEGTGEDLEIEKIRSCWREAAGPLANHSMPDHLNKGRLTVRVEKTVYSQELSLYAPRIIKTLKQKGIHSVNLIVTRTGPLDWKESAPPVAKRDIKNDSQQQQGKSGNKAGKDPSPGETLPEEINYLLGELSRRKGS